jgi:hypothetical protein
MIRNRGGVFLWTLKGQVLFAGLCKKKTRLWLLYGLRLMGGVLML